MAKNKKKEKEPEENKPQEGFDFNKPKQPKFSFNFYWIYGIIIVAFLAFNIFSWGGGPKEIPYQTFERDMLMDHAVEKIIVINEKTAEVYIKKDKLREDRFKDVRTKSIANVENPGPHYYFNIGSVETFEKKLAEAQKDFAKEEKLDVQYQTKSNTLGDIMGWILPIVIMIVIWMFIMRRMGGGGAGGSQLINIGKSKATLFDKDSHVNITFNDVAGLEEAKVEVMEIVDFLKNPKKYTSLGGKIPRGALLVGPPGTGKTLLAKAVAGEAQVPFFSMSGSDFVEMFVCVAGSRVRDLFRQAKEKAPCIIFIDEIDAIGRARGKNASFSSNDERESTLNQLLTEMDGFGSNSGVIILGATNRADVLDRALLRPGRFDRQIYVELPDLHGRKEIFQVHLKPLKLDDSDRKSTRLNSSHR